eukprot:2193772-Pyramimonas_sp.AAC.1
MSGFPPAPFFRKVFKDRGFGRLHRAIEGALLRRWWPLDALGERQRRLRDFAIARWLWEFLERDGLGLSLGLGLRSRIAALEAPACRGGCSHGETAEAGR